LSTLYEFGEMEDIKIKIGLRVKELRISKGYSQEQLAELADLDRTYIPGIESGKRNISIVVVEKLAMAFQITISELMNDL
jgi:transcriptional regulator with XRE-family HTH domain